MRDSLSCSCSQSYVKTYMVKDKIAVLKESIIDDFSLLMFKSLDDLQDELKAVKAKEEAEEKRRRYEENVRLGLIKKKGRKSKAQLEKERKLERRRLRREKKEQRRRDRRERREREAREGTSVDSEERRLRRERKRERKERRERELIGDDKLEKKERKRKLKDPNAAKKPARHPGEEGGGVEGMDRISPLPCPAYPPPHLKSCMLLLLLLLLQVLVGATAALPGRPKEPQ
ncbi:unnamed protein product [Acanthocheilonema viteae]|uniref:Uncharacterized protein n=1 Tax=Acanthocheilonema viteae TaxID=6277 RepID=A0A498SIF7_ACAVI|nr:unnamed protein product [Acanthocheilonema viteae]